MNKRKIELLGWLYIVFGIFSLILIGCYWIKTICEDLRNVLMSIGASLIGAVVLSVFIELINKKKKLKIKRDILSDSILISKETLNELDKVFNEFKNNVDIPIEFDSDDDFINKSMKYYLELTDKRDPSYDAIAEKMRVAIFSKINDSFIIDCCKNSISIFDIVLNSQNELIMEGVITKDEIKNIFMAKWRMQSLINESENNKFSILLSNKLNFRNYLIKITEIKSK